MGESNFSLRYMIMVALLYLSNLDYFLATEWLDNTDTTMIHSSLRWNFSTRLKLEDQRLTS